MSNFTQIIEFHLGKKHGWNPMPSSHMWGSTQKHKFANQNHTLCQVFQYIWLKVCYLSGKLKLKTQFPAIHLVSLTKPGPISKPAIESGRYFWEYCTCTLCKHGTICIENKLMTFLLENKRKFHPLSLLWCGI